MWIKYHHQQKKIIGITKKIQNVNNCKRNGIYFHATLFINNAPIKFNIDSGLPVTLIPQRLFNKITEVEELKTNYKEVNDNKVDFMGQIKATVKSNSVTLQLPLLITKANITLLMGLDWMKRLGITLNTRTNNIKLHNIRMDETEKKILKLKNEFKDLSYNNTEIKNLGVKLDLKENAKNTTKEKTSSKSSTRQSSRRNQKTKKTRIFVKGHGNN